MKHFISLILVLLIGLVPTGAVLAADLDTTGLNYSGIPTFSIVSVVPDSSVTIRTHNFPANDRFAVLMNYMGTRGVGGIQVDTISSGSGGSFTLTFAIPAAMQGQYQVAIRLQSVTGSGYFAYNWFYNKVGGGIGRPYTPPNYTGYPTFSILSVVRDKTVTIQAYNFPANDKFDVLMNYMGTKGKNGIKVDRLSTGTGGSFKETFSIPAALQGERQIAIRLQSVTGSGYFAYNWFWNNTAGGTGAPVSPSPGYSGIPTFTITAVVRNSTVSIRTNNFPANDKFAVLMNFMGTKGVGGIQVDTISSGSGGAFNATFNIPASLQGQRQIAIRLQSVTGSGYFAYNWFWNNTYP